MALELNWCERKLRIRLRYGVFDWCVISPRWSVDRRAWTRAFFFFMYHCGYMFYMYVDRYWWCILKAVMVGFVFCVCWKLELSEEVNWNGSIEYNAWWNIFFFIFFFARQCVLICIFFEVLMCECDCLSCICNDKLLNIILWNKCNCCW